VSGHSKWANIKRQKAVVDAKKGAIYARIGRDIIVAARQGGGDVNANFRLRQAVERAKAEGVPNDNIARAIAKGSGNDGASALEELIYEGYGPGGVAIMVRCATDNRNRTAGDLRSYFSKYNGNLGETGCVRWIFQERGQIVLKRSSKISEDALLSVALEAGAEDLDDSAADSITVICKPTEIDTVRQALEANGLQATSSEVLFDASNTVTVTDKDTAKQLLRLLDAVENQDDVQEVYTNFDMAQEWIQEFLG
jgi:YebC/PmpR family DNA-binding regulatory protein